jgi:hypothetical protein
MFRLILFLSLFPVAISLLLRWWFGVRILKSLGTQNCRCDLNTWPAAPDEPNATHRAEATAAVFGEQLRDRALIAWKNTDPKAAKARENCRRFGTAVPPLSALVAVLAVIVGKIPIIGAVAILLGATAIAAAMSLLSLPSELAIITRATGITRKHRHFPNSDDEDAVTRCAFAHAWDASVPAFLRLM